MSKKAVPTFDNLMNPLIEALKSLGGSGTADEIFNKVVEIARLSDEQLKVIHKGRVEQTEVEYRLAWSRTCKRYADPQNIFRLSLTL